MAKIVIKNAYRIDVEKTSKQLHETMVQFTKDTLVEWVIHTTQPIPVWSGAARASFIKLANQVQYNVDVSPIVSPPSVGDRTILGINESRGEIIISPLSTYGWVWQSTLDYIGIVDDHVNFIDVGQKSIENKSPKLPQPIRANSKTKRV